MSTFLLMGICIVSNVLPVMNNIAINFLVLVFFVDILSKKYYKILELHVWLIVHTSFFVPNQYLKAMYFKDFPVGPAIKTQPSNAVGPSSIAGLGIKIPHASWCAPTPKHCISGLTLCKKIFTLFQ